MDHTPTPTYGVDPTRYTLTNHAEQRMAQRNLSLDDVCFVLYYGKKFHRAGAIIYYLRYCDIPRDKQARKAFSRLEGTAVVVSRNDPSILTVFRNRQKGLHYVKQKSRYDRAHAFCPEEAMAMVGTADTGTSSFGV